MCAWIGLALVFVGWVCTWVYTHGFPWVQTAGLVKGYHVLGWQTYEALKRLLLCINGYHSGLKYY